VPRSKLAALFKPHTVIPAPAEFAAAAKSRGKQAVEILFHDESPFLPAIGRRPEA
jgi:hypothetical protein